MPPGAPMIVGSCWIPTGHLPSGYVKIAIEHGPFIMDLPIENGDFP